MIFKMNELEIFRGTRLCLTLNINVAMSCKPLVVSRLQTWFKLARHAVEKNSITAFIKEIKHATRSKEVPRLVPLCHSNEMVYSP